MILRLMLTGLVAMTACAPTASEAPPEALEEAEALPLQIAFQGLCDARTLAASGDVLGASDLFQDRSHAYLHEFADRVSASDRDAAARLLEAKQAVEAQLAIPDVANAQAVAGSISALETALGDAAESAGFARPVCGGAAA